jgi:hypothetical protein
MLLDARKLRKRNKRQFNLDLVDSDVEYLHELCVKKKVFIVLNDIFIGVLYDTL